MDDKEKTERDFSEWANRKVRGDFVRGVSDVLRNTPAAPEKPAGRSNTFTRAEQARVLRQMADNLDKAGAREGAVKRTEQRLAERSLAQSTQFFVKPESRVKDSAYWIERAKQSLVERKTVAPARDRDRDR